MFIANSLSATVLDTYSLVVPIGIEDMWQVVLVKAPKVFLWKSDYFPRTFRYKKDAIAVKVVVERNGGTAKIVKQGSMA